MSPETAKILLYSDDRTTREQVRLALGRSVAHDLPQLEIYEVATQAAVLAGRVPICYAHHDRADGGPSGHDYRSTATGAHASGAGRPRSACGRCT